MAGFVHWLASPEGLLFVVVFTVAFRLLVIR